MSYTNDSYSRCIAELRARYGSRGVSVNVKSEELTQKKAEEASVAASNYYLFDARSGIASNFKSGDAIVLNEYISRNHY